MSTDLQNALRRGKSDKWKSKLLVRPPHLLVEWTSLLSSRSVTLLPDTNVYINVLAGRIAGPLLEIFESALAFHCSVALSELAVGVANANPSRNGWLAVCDYYAKLFAAVPQNRLISPDPQIWADAGVIAGTLARTQGFQPHQRKDCLNDALIFLTATKAGIPVLTANRDDFDLIQQIAPEGRFIYY